jgi:hypothetical protein
MKYEAMIIINLTADAARRDIERAIKEFVEGKTITDQVGVGHVSFGDIIEISLMKED